MLKTKEGHIIARTLSGRLVEILDKRKDFDGVVYLVQGADPLFAKEAKWVSGKILFLEV